MNDTKLILQTIKETVAKKFPEAEIILFGSRARGTSSKQSDWDLLILLNQKKITPAIEESITYPLFDLEIEFGELISPIVYTKSDWENKHVVTPLYKQIAKEGKTL